MCSLSFYPSIFGTADPTQGHREAEVYPRSSFQDTVAQYGSFRTANQSSVHVSGLREGTGEPRRNHQTQEEHANSIYTHRGGRNRTHNPEGKRTN